MPGNGEESSVLRGGVVEVNHAVDLATPRAWSPMSWRTAGVHTVGRVGCGVLVDVGVSILKLDA
jgi:hypothetical protein